MIYLTADTTNGVQPSEPFNPENYDVLGGMDFYDALKDLQDGETIRGVVNGKVFDKIVADYGVRL